MRYAPISGSVIVHDKDFKIIGSVWEVLHSHRPQPKCPILLRRVFRWPTHWLAELLKIQCNVVHALLTCRGWWILLWKPTNSAFQSVFIDSALPILYSAPFHGISTFGGSGRRQSGQCQHTDVHVHCPTSMNPYQYYLYTHELELPVPMHEWRPTWLSPIRWPTCPYLHHLGLIYWQCNTEIP